MTDFPDVPPFPGVPPLVRPADYIPPDPTQLLTGDSAQVQSAAANSGNQWGIFNADGTQTLPYDSIVSVEPIRDFRNTDAPTEDGGFQSYNKVQIPREIKVRVAKGGQVSDRTNFLSVLDIFIESLALFSVTTPDCSYMNMNPDHYSFQRRAENGVTLLLVDIYMVEIRMAPNPAFSTTKVANPASADAVNDGAVQPATLTPTQQAAAQGFN